MQWRSAGARAGSPLFPGRPVEVSCRRRPRPVRTSHCRNCRLAHEEADARSPLVVVHRLARRDARRDARVPAVGPARRGLRRGRGPFPRFGRRRLRGATSARRGRRGAAAALLPPGRSRQRGARRGPGGGARRRLGSDARTAARARPALARRQRPAVPRRGVADRRSGTRRPVPGAAYLRRAGYRRSDSDRPAEPHPAGFSRHGAGGGGHGVHRPLSALARRPRHLLFQAGGGAPFRRRFSLRGEGERFCRRRGDRGRRRVRGDARPRDAVRRDASHLPPGARRDERVFDCGLQPQPGRGLLRSRCDGRVDESRRRDLRPRFADRTAARDAAPVCRADRRTRTDRRDRWVCGPAAGESRA